MSAVSMLHIFPPVLSSLFVMLILPHYTHQYVYGGDLKDVYFYKPGDFLIGGSFGVTVDCKHIQNSIPYFMMRTLVYAVEVMNKVREVGRNFELGYVIVDTCDNVNISALQALRFIPQTNLTAYDATEVPGYLRSFEVIGLVGTDSSSTTIPFSYVLGAVNLPVISSGASEDELSDKMHYPTFFRITSAQRQQINALLQFMSKKGWLYFSVITEKTSYGRDCMKLLNIGYKSHGLSIAVISSVSDDVDAESLLLYHRKHFGVYVIVVFVRYNLVQKVSKAVKTSGLEGSLVIIGCNFFLYDMYYGNLNKGFLVLGASPYPVPGLKNYLLELDEKEAQDPWLINVYETIYKCFNTFCAQRMADDTNVLNTLAFGDIVDTVKIYVRALSSLLQTLCLGKSKAEAVSCFRKHRGEMVSYIENVKSFTDQSNLVFDEDRIRVSAVSIFQSVVHDVGHKIVEISRFDYYTKTTTFLKEIDFQGFTVPEEKFLASHHCQPKCPGDAFRNYHTRFCWACVQCSYYEIVTDNGTHCKKCPTLYWPSYQQGTKTTCELIEVSYTDVNSVKSQILIFLSTVLLIITLFVQYYYYIKKESLVITGFHFVIANVQISAIAAGYLAIPVLVLQPRRLNCFFGLSLFEISFNALYLSLAIKTFDLFFSSKKHHRKSYVRELEISATVVFAVFEAIIIVFMHFAFPAKMVSQQPSLLVNYVEKVCIFPSVHIYWFLGQTLTILTLCMLMIARYRTFQFHYLESEFLSMCLTIKITTWAAFIPAYFMSQRLQIRIYYIILAIISNHTTALALLIAPRLYYVLTNNRKLSTIYDTRLELRDSSVIVLTSVGLKNSTMNLKAEERPTENEPPLLQN